MGEALKEFGKHLLNLALAIAIYLLIQPFLKGNNTLRLILVGVAFYFVLIILGIVLINLGDRLEKGGSKNG